MSQPYKRLRSSRQQQRARAHAAFLSHQPQAVDAFEVEEMQILDHEQRRVPAVSFVRASTRARATWVWVNRPNLSCSALGLASSTLPSGPSSRCSIPAAARPHDFVIRRRFASERLPG